MIYLDNAATTKPCGEAVEAVRDAMNGCFGNASSLHKMGTLSMQIISRAKMTALAAVSGTKTPFEGDVIFTSGATESNNTAILGIAERCRNRKKIVTTAIEHPSVAKTMEILEKRGFEVVRLAPKDYKNHAEFEDAICNAVDEKTFLVSAMAVNNETGYFIDTVRLYKEIKSRFRDVCVHIDAVQGFLKVPPDGDLISVSGHKIHSPKGIGALFIKKGVRIPPLLSGGGQQNGLRSGTEPVELIAGFCAAIEAYHGEREKFSELKNYLVEKLSEIPDIKLNSDDECVPNIVNFSVRGVRSEIMLHSLEEDEIYVSSGSACSKGKKSGVLGALGVSDKDADCAVRVSFCAENTKDEIDRLVKKIGETVERVRR